MSSSELSKDDGKGRTFWVMENNGLETHSQEAEPGPNQGTFPTPSMVGPVNICPVEFQNCCGLVISMYN